MKDKYIYTSKIQKIEEKNGAYVSFPYDLRKEFGKGRLKVTAYFDGVEYKGSVVNMGIKNTDGTVCYIIGITKAIREQIGKQPGDSIIIEIIPET